MNCQQICITHHLVGSLGYRFLDEPIVLCKLGCLFARVSIHPKVKWIITQLKFATLFFTEKATQLPFTCSKSTIETLEKGVKYVQN